jgi:hypothetical protein
LVKNLRKAITKYNGSLQEKMDVIVQKKAVEAKNAPPPFKKKMKEMINLEKNVWRQKLGFQDFGIFKTKCTCFILEDENTKKNDITVG